MLTPEKIAEMDKITGLTSENIQQKNIQSRVSELQSLSTPKKKEGVLEKIGNFTGGTKLAQGVAQTIANKTIEKDLGETKKFQDEAQKNIIAQMEKNRMTGKDNTHLIQALQSLNNDIAGLGNDTGKLLNQDQLTPKQVVGDALQLGTTVLGAGQIPGVAKSATGATGIVKGAIQGAKSGAIAGGVFGASQGASGALKEDKSALDIAKSTGLGALEGVAGGALVGGAVGGVSGGIKQIKINNTKKEEAFGKELVMPKATAKVKQQALKEGRVTEQGLFKGSKILPSQRDERTYEAVKDVISSKKSPVQNIESISNKVEEINSGVKAYIAEKKVPFNTNQIKSQLNKGKEELNLVFASDKQAEKTYDAVVNEFMKHVAKKDTLGVFEARQALDKVPAIKKLLDSQGLGENAKKEIVLTVREMANQYVANKLPKGNLYRDALLKETRMLSAIKNIAESNTKTIGKSKLVELFQKYPALNWLVGGVATGIVGSAGVGVGNAIIKSTD